MKMFCRPVVFLCLLTGLGLTQAADVPSDGMERLASGYSVEQTVQRLEAIFEAKGVTLFARVDHQAGAEKVGLALRPTVLLIFGNPKLGTPLMQCRQALAIDLPQKALIYEDANGKVWLAYNDLNYLRQRHDAHGCEAAFSKVDGVLQKLMTKAVR